MVAQRDERVLQRRARARVGVDVAGGDGRDPEPLRQLGELAVAGAVMTLEGPLQLDAQVVGAEGGQQPPQRRLVVHAVVRAAAQQHQPGRVLLQRLERHRGRRLVLVAIVHVGAGDDPAEVAPAHRVLDQQRHVPPVRQVHLGAVDRSQPERLGRHRELHRARDPVVVGDRHRLVPGRGGGRRELRGRRGAVQEGEGRVRVELDVGHEHTFARDRTSSATQESSSHALIDPTSGTGLERLHRSARWRSRTAAAPRRRAELERIAAGSAARPVLIRVPRTRSYERHGAALSALLACCSRGTS